MPRIVAKVLTDKECSHLKEPGVHAVGGEPGLYLRISESGVKSWFFRATIGHAANGKQIRKEIGIGKYPSVTLRDARKYARDLRLKIEQGIDPVLEKKLEQKKISKHSVCR